MSERVCQFFLRGRCQREKCEFRHPADRAPIAAAAPATTATTTAVAAPAKVLPPIPVSLPEKKPGFESDDDVSVDSENESIVSGFVVDGKVVPEVNSFVTGMPEHATVSIISS
jgi:hypothetical protein